MLNDNIEGIQIAILVSQLLSRHLDHLLIILALIWINKTLLLIFLQVCLIQGTHRFACWVLVLTLNASGLINQMLHVCRSCGD